MCGGIFSSGKSIRVCALLLGFYVNTLATMVDG